MPAKVTSSLRRAGCSLCEASCGLIVQVENGAVTDVRGDPDDPLSLGHICPKGVALQDLQTDPAWLRTPLERTETGWRELPWEEAIELAASRLADVATRHGPDSVAVYLGNPNVHSLGAMLSVPPLLTALGTKNSYSAGSVDQWPHQLVAWAMFGHQFLIPVPDIDRCEVLVLFGHNPMATNGSIWTVPAFPRRAKALRERGGRLIVVDPRRSETARIADEHHFIRPGTDAFVLLAMVRTILERNLARPADYVDGICELRDLVSPFTIAQAAERSGLAPDVIVDLAVQVATRRAAIHGRVGLSTQSFGLVCQWAIQVLHALTGNLDREGGVLFDRPAVDLAQRWMVPAGGHGRWHSRVRGLPESLGELPVATMADEMLTPGPGQVRALLTVGGNPIVTTPGGRRLAQAIDGLEFSVAIDPYLNATTSRADLILPPSRPLERDHYDIIFRSLAVRNTARFTPAVLPRPAEARHEWEIMRDLVRGWYRATGRRIPLMQRLALAGTPTTTLDLLLRFGARRTSVRTLLASPAGVDFGPLQACLPRRLQTPGRRIRLVPDLIRDDIPRLLREPAQLSAQFPLLLVGRRHLRDNNSWMGDLDRLNRGGPRHHLLIHPEDALARGLTDGSTVAVVSRAGRLQTVCSVTDDMRQGVVSLPHGYGWGRDGASSNDVTDPALTDESAGTAVVNGVPVDVSVVAR